MQAVKEFLLTLQIVKPCHKALGRAGADILMQLDDVVGTTVCDEASFLKP